MKIVVCVKYVPDATADAAFADRQHRRPCRRRRAAVRARRVRRRAGAADRRGRGRRRGHRAHDRARAGAADALARRCRWAPTPACTSTTTRSTAPTPSRPRWCWPRRSRRLELRPGRLRHGLDRRRHGRRAGDARRAARAARRSTFASELTVGDGTVHDPPRRRHAHRRPSRRRCRRVVSVTDQIGEARYPSFKGIMAAKKKPVRDAGPGRPGHRRRPGRARRGLDAVVDVARRGRRAQAGQVVTDEGDGGAQLAEFLAGQKFI